MSEKNPHHEELNEQRDEKERKLVKEYYQRSPAPTRQLRQSDLSTHPLCPKDFKTGGIVITGRTNVDNVRILTLRSALKLEVQGLKRKGRSAYSIVKKEFGFKGSKQRVLEQLNQYIEENILND